MKLTSKNQYFRPSSSSGLYENAFIKTGRTEFDGDFVKVTFFFGYNDGEKDVKVSEFSPEMFNERQDTIIENENEQPEELRAFLFRGGTYSKEKIIDWGRPSKEDLINDYLKAESLLTGTEVELTDNEPQRTIAMDWLLERVFVFGKPLGEHFEFEAE